MDVRVDRTASSATAELPPRGPRSPQSKRGDARRRTLLEAALTVIGREGLDAVSHRRVAEVAGVPLGSTTYYFNSREDMLVQALQHFARGEIQQLDELFGSVSGEEWARAGAAEFVERLVALARPQLAEGSWSALAQYTLFQESARRPELRPVVQQWTEAWWSLLATVLAALDRPHAEVDVQMALGMLDGLLLTGIAMPREDYADAVLRPALRRWLGID